MTSFLGDTSSQDPLTMNTCISLNILFGFICNPRCIFIIASNYFIWNITWHNIQKFFGKYLCHTIYCFITKQTSPISFAKNLIHFIKILHNMIFPYFHFIIRWWTWNINIYFSVNNQVLGMAFRVWNYFNIDKGKRLFSKDYINTGLGTIVADVSWLIYKFLRVVNYRYFA